MGGRGSGASGWALPRTGCWTPRRGRRPRRSERVQGTGLGAGGTGAHVLERASRCVGFSFSVAGVCECVCVCHFLGGSDFSREHRKSFRASPPAPGGMSSRMFWKAHSDRQAGGWLSPGRKTVFLKSLGRKSSGVSDSRVLLTSRVHRGFPARGVGVGLEWAQGKVSRCQVCGVVSDRPCGNRVSEEASQSKIR